MTSVPAAASPLTAALVHGPIRTARVAAAGRAGVYLLLGEDLLPVLSPGALRLPGALLVGGPVAWGVEVGDEVEVGDGEVRLPGAVVRVVRYWRPARVRRVTTRFAPGVVEVLDAAGAAPHLVARAAAVVENPLDDARWLPLVGAGPGLTPSGDDALCGVLLARYATGGPVPGEVVARVRHRTTALSAGLLDAARQGYGVPEVVALVDAAMAGDARATAARLPAVLAIGHSSGRDLVAGLLATLCTPTVSTQMEVTTCRISSKYAGASMSTR